MSRPSSRLVRVNEAGYPVGQDHHRSKLTDHEVDLALELLADGMSQREVAKKLEVSQMHVWRLSNGRGRSQLVTTTVRRRIRYEEPEFQPAAWHEFDDATP